MLKFRMPWCVLTSLVARPADAVTVANANANANGNGNGNRNASTSAMLQEAAMGLERQVMSVWTCSAAELWHLAVQKADLHNNEKIVHIVSSRCMRCLSSAMHMASSE